MTAQTLRVRDTTVADAGAVARVQISSWRAAYAGIVPEQHLREVSVRSLAERAAAERRHPDPAVHHLVAEHGLEVVAFCAAGPTRDDDLPPGTGELYALYADPAYWSTGVGRALMREALDRLRACGYTAVVLWVLAGNTRGRRFYAAAGFHADGESRVIRMSAPVPEVRYTRELGTTAV